MEKKYFIVFIIIFALGIGLGMSWGAYSMLKLGTHLAEKFLDIKCNQACIDFIVQNRGKIEQYAGIRNLTVESLFR